jgi:outer membrane protein assembly factor BamD
MTYIKPKTILTLSLCTILAVSLSACSTFSQKKNRADLNSTASAEQLLRVARTSVKHADFEQAIKQYETLEARYPLGRYAQQALLEQAYAYYKFDEPDTALDTIDRYMRLYPRGPKMDYALYLRGLINFTRGGSIIDKVFPRNFSDLDNVRQKEAFHDFSQLVTRHPGSVYAADAKKRLHFLKNSLGFNEINIAKYYYKRGAYLAAFNRAEYTIEHHQGTPAVIEALQLKICAARKLGKKDLADATLRVLRLNFPAKSKFSCNFK